MGKRTRWGRHTYLERDRNGRFKKFTNISRSMRADRAKKARTKVSSGYGHQGDLREALSLDSVYRF